MFVFKITDLLERINGEGVWGQHLRLAAKGVRSSHRCEVQEPKGKQEMNKKPRPYEAGRATEAKTRRWGWNDGEIGAYMIVGSGLLEDEVKFCSGK